MLPPAVAGHRAAGRVRRHRAARRPRSRTRGIVLPFTEWAVVLAVTFVASPFYLRQAIAAFESVDPTLPDAARTLGAGPGAHVPRASRCRSPRAGCSPGWVLAFARGVGEFGATIIFAGNVQGQTQTLTLAIYEQLETTSTSRSRSAILLVRAQRRRPALVQAALLVATLELDIAVALRSFALERPRWTSARETRRARRPVRRRQDDGPARDRRAAAPDAGRDRARRRRLVRRGGRRRPAARAALGRPRLPGLRAVPAPDASARTSRSAGRARVDELLERLRHRAPRATSARARSPAASASASRSPARWRATRRCCCSTSRSSALDAHTRAAVRGELQDLLAELALPTLLVTHDFRDAAALADRVGVIVDGRLRQLGTPAELRRRPGRRVRRRASPARTC